MIRALTISSRRIRASHQSCNSAASRRAPRRKRPNPSPSKKCGWVDPRHSRLIREWPAPEWAGTLSEVEVLGEGDFRLYLGALAFPLLVRAGTLKERVGELARLLPKLDKRYPKLAFIDLRFDRRIIFQPAL